MSGIVQNYASGCTNLANCAASVDDNENGLSQTGGMMMNGRIAQAYPDLSQAIDVGHYDAEALSKGLKLLINVVVAACLWLTITSFI